VVQFDLRNGSLRKKFDSVKYTLKKLEVGVVVCKAADVYRISLLPIKLHLPSETRGCCGWAGV
jgi:hypothetical protein